MQNKLLYVVSEDWYFLSHRLPMARAAKAAGFDVHVACHVVDGAAAIEREGFVLHPIRFARGRISPTAALATILDLRKLHARVAPQIVHHVSMQPAVLGSLAALGTNTACVNALTGLGYIFASQTSKARAMRPLFSMLLRWLLRRSRTVALVQNPDDHAALVALGVTSGKIVTIQGSGVDTERLHPMPEPAGQVTAAFVGRLLDDKGIRTLVAAQQILHARGLDSHLLIAGSPDPANPASVSEAEARAWNGQSGMTWLGHVTDIPALWERSHIAVLPSRREGLPLSLLEAAACGRPMVATDVPGCREVVTNGETGLLVPADDPTALADALEKVVRSPDLRRRFGKAARNAVLQRFSATIIARQIAELYRALLNPAQTR